ncbi:MAG: 4-hydroxy-3-methylbut-2-enyl diphosphate reductase [Candidatus Saganbacteria bacterium]|nr:4-hydroxy-3-methylbut-2-enyl diphosphate reductase [Candidatus Saganbacteria bacterium]
MEILVAKHSGFCEGVERAFRIALKESRAGRQLYMLGNLVHNKQVIDKFKSLGVRTIGSIYNIPAGSSGTVLISAHGVPPEIYETAKIKGLNIVDTTCAWVKKAQRLARELAAESRTVIILGDKGHTEVKGLVGWSQGKAVVIENIADLDRLSLQPEQKIGLISQTTQAEKTFQEIEQALKKRSSDVKAFNTVCGATTKRQNACLDLAGKVDLMLVIGDQLSANTKRLSELCSQTGTPTHQIQSKAELNKAWLNNTNKIGVTAGASTPDWVIQEVVDALKVC